MTSQTHNDLPQISNNNVIKIPYSDNQEESLIDSSIHINGFTIIELDEEKKDYINLIPSYEEDINIGKKQKIHLESRAKNVENYYSVYQDGVVPNVNCSRCFLSNFTSNDLLYFKDRKALILYLKYCFIYLKRSIFMNHFLYMKNKNELNKINQSFYNGWKFLIPKTICKACFIQLINMEYLFSNIKNIICDYYGTNKISPPPQTKNPHLLNNKRRRVISKNKKKKIPIQKEVIHLDDKSNGINTQITPIVIPIHENVIIQKKKRRNTNNVFKKRKIKNIKKNIKKKYNENIIYDEKNNILIINKKGIRNLQIDEDSLIINKIINDNKKNTTNIEKENQNQNNKKDEKLKFISRNKDESDSLTNKKTVKKDKKNEINVNENKDINDNNNKNYSNNNNIPKNIDKKNTIIINNFNNNNSKSDEINMNKVGLIQINNNQFENNNLNNYSNNDFNITNSLKQKNNNILLNNLNNNNNFSNSFNYTNISIIKQLFFINSFINPIRLNLDILKLQICLNNLINFAANIKQNIINNNIGNINQYIKIIFIHLAKMDDILNTFNETQFFLDYSINIIMTNIRIFQNNLNSSNNNSNYNYNELFSILNNLEDNSKIIKYKYNELFRESMIICNNLKGTIENIVPIKFN